ncbi:MAG: thioredoxin fold domain-containing protein [Ignavibacteria bacterium]|nr:thioredoxin fold domain-containing protein [Ignavibacteria bacterium]
MKKNISLLILFLFFTKSILAQDILSIDSKINFDKIHPGSELKFLLQVNINSGWHINSNKPNEDFLIPTELTVISSNGLKLKNVVYPKPKEIKLGFSDLPVSVFEGREKIYGTIEIPKNLLPGKYKFDLTLSYQACNDQSCLPPKEVSQTFEIEVVNLTIAIKEINTEYFQEIKNLNQAGENKQETKASGIFDNGNIILTFILIFIGGLALNLTPCVYPLIPITIGFFGGQSESKLSKLLLLSSLYVIGMAITYSTIGVITALTGSLFGSALQNPIVLIFIALVLVGLSLSMFGLYEIQLPASLVNKFGSARSGIFGSLFMGLTMGIVAAPCIGPFVIGLLTYVGAKGDIFLGFSMFFVLALGLGTPYLFLGIFSGKIKSLPRSGEWMVGVRKIFGFVLIGMAIYFILPLIPKNLSSVILPAFMILSALFLLFFDKVGEKVKGYRIFKIIFLTLVIILGGWMLIPSKTNSIDWEYPNTTIFQLQGKPTLMDFYADWCIPCKELDAETFSDAKVIAESKRFQNLKLDLTDANNPNTIELTEKYKILGVPTLILFDSSGNEVERITGFIAADKFLEVLRKVK